MTCRVRVSRVVMGVGLLIASSCASVEDTMNGDGVSASPGDVEPPAPDPTTPTPGDTSPVNDAPTQRAAAREGYTATRYPIVLAHGASGFDKLFGVLEYFHGIPGELTSGGAKVYVTEVTALGSSDERGQQLLDQIEYIVAATGCGKVNIIGHSQGGLDARYVAAKRPDLVASVTTVGTPHLGSGLADWFLDHTTDGGFSQTVVEVFGDLLGMVLNLLAGTDNPSDALGIILQVSSDGAASWNARFPAGLPSTRCGSGAESANGIRFYSWSGSSALTHALDPSDAAFAITTWLTGGDNDGLVERCSSHFGRVIRDDYRMNHLDEVNQVLGLTSWFEVDPTSLFRAHANRLKNAGL